MITWKAKLVGVVTMTKECHHFLTKKGGRFFEDKNRARPSVTAPDDTSLSDASVKMTTDMLTRLDIHIS